MVTGSERFCPLVREGAMHEEQKELLSNIRKLKSGVGHQSGARHQDELAD
jgi:hypothetical protein